ncbi:MAG: hypothetical protein ACI4AQ_01825 [Lachnospiraceae bacterium]
MVILKHFINKYRDKIIIAVQAILGLIFAFHAIDKELEARFKIAQKVAKDDAKRKKSLKNAAMKNAKKLAKAKFRVKEEKLKTKAKCTRILGDLAVQKHKARAKRKKAKLKDRSK